MTTYYDVGYQNTLCFLGLEKEAGREEIKATKKRYDKKREERSAAKEMKASGGASENPHARKLQAYLSGGDVGTQPTTVKERMREYAGPKPFEAHQPKPAATPKAPSSSGVDKLRQYLGAPAPAAAPTAQATNATKATQAASAVKEPGLLSKVKGTWSKMGPVGKGLAIGGAGLGLLGAGAGAGMLASSPAPAVMVV